jgi:hypothetical protein
MGCDANCDVNCDVHCDVECDVNCDVVFPYVVATRKPVLNRSEPFRGNLWPGQSFEQICDEKRAKWDSLRLKKSSPILRHISVTSVKLRLPFNLIWLVATWPMPAKLKIDL